MNGVPYHMWTAYYLLLLAHQDARPKTMLDVCCGTGNMCELLHQEGFQVSGFDISSLMIDKARGKAQSMKYPIRYEVADAATVAMGETYDAAFSFFDSLNYITDPAKLQQALHRVAAHLPSGGSFIFDVNTDVAFEEELFTQEDLKAKSEVKYKWKGNWDSATRVIRVDMTFWHQGEEVHETHEQRAYSDEELRDMLAAAGFHQVRAFHSYTLNPPRKKSDRLHYMCLKV